MRPQRWSLSDALNVSHIWIGMNCVRLFVIFTPRFLLQMSEMEISRAVAERSLREHMGNVVEALVTLTN